MRGGESNTCPPMVTTTTAAAAAQERGRALADRNEALRTEIDALAADRFVQERAVREELRWARPGEVVVRVPRGDALSSDGGRSLP